MAMLVLSVHGERLIDRFLHLCVDLRLFKQIALLGHEELLDIAQTHQTNFDFRLSFLDFCVYLS